MINKYQKAVQTKITKQLLGLIVLRLVYQESSYGYQVAAKIRNSFGVYFGPSTVYPILAYFNKRGYIHSEWDMTSKKPHKIFTITKSGIEVIKSTENSLELICKTINAFEPLSKATGETSAFAN